MFTTVSCYISALRTPDVMCITAVACSDGDRGTMNIIAVEHKVDKCACRLLLHEISQKYSMHDGRFVLFADTYIFNSMKSAVDDISLPCSVDLRKYVAGDNSAVGRNAIRCQRIVESYAMFDV